MDVMEFKRFNGFKLAIKKKKVLSKYVKKGKEKEKGL